jgi:hypothetical protein
VDGCEILHQLIDGRNAIIYRVSNILLVVQDFFHQQYFSIWLLVSTHLKNINQLGE